MLRCIGLLVHFSDLSSRSGDVRSLEQSRRRPVAGRGHLLTTRNGHGGLKLVFICWSPDLEVRITLDEEVPGREENAPTEKGLAK